jgi:hypothetical protein
VAKANYNGLYNLPLAQEVVISPVEYERILAEARAAAWNEGWVAGVAYQFHTEDSHQTRGP